MLEYSYRLKYDNGSIKIVKSINESDLNIVKPRFRQTGIDFSAIQKSKIEKWLVHFKLKIFKLGILNYDDAYFLAEVYLSKFPDVKKYIQKRFRFVFVDEMQDMDKHQYSILEEIFFDEGNSESIYQRIGDKNQSIFNGRVSLEDIWEDREVVLKLKGSHRLTERNSEIINCLMLNRDDDYQVIGLNSGDIKPHILVYTDATIKNVIPAYSQIVKEFIKSGDIIASPDNSYNVIGWVKEHLEEHKTSIKDYCDEYEVNKSVKKIDYSNLDSYLSIIDKSKGTLEPYRKNILNSLIRVLRYENVTNPKTNRPYSKKTLISFLKDNFSKDYEVLKSYLYSWSITLVKGDFKKVYEEVKQYIPHFLSLFGKSVSNSNNFINDTSQIQTSDEVNNIKNSINYNGFDINIGTVHSSKGQTHTCTLYLETFHKNGGGGNYEWQRLSSQLKLTPFSNSTIKIVKQTLKMAYVGLSRPTSLLCIAIHQDRFNATLSDLDKEKWEILNIN